jgi:hypothetical protein
VTVRPGRTAQYDVLVDGHVVIGKTQGTFPTPAEVVEAVRKAVS